MGDEQERMAEAIRQIVTRRERAPRSPRLERAFKRLIWRYGRSLRQHSPSHEDQNPTGENEADGKHRSPSPASSE